MNMKSMLIMSFILAVVTAFTFAFKPMNNEVQKIGEVIGLYENALNTNDVEGVLQLFPEDGVLVMQGAPTCVGMEALREFYVAIFSKIDFNTMFTIEETVQMSPEWAFIRTTARPKDSTDAAERGHEIFILKKQADGNWKIARYAGSSAK